jgi:hypothetical protein
MKDVLIESKRIVRGAAKPTWKMQVDFGRDYSRRFLLDDRFVVGVGEPRGSGIEEPRYNREIDARQSFRSDDEFGRSDDIDGCELRQPERVGVSKIPCLDRFGTDQRFSERREIRIFDGDRARAKAIQVRRVSGFWGWVIDTLDQVRDMLGTYDPFP